MAESSGLLGALPASGKATSTGSHMSSSLLGSLPASGKATSIGSHMSSGLLGSLPASGKVTSTGSHIFAEFESLEGLNAPIRASGRIKYTSIGVSRRYIAMGASTGGLYIFHRESLKYLQVISNKEGAITKVAFAPEDNIVGFATSLGFVIAWELNMDLRDPPERLVVSTAHRNAQVTCLQWDSASVRLFSGDDKGRVTQSNADSRKASGFFKMPTELVLTLDSPIVQLDFADDKVLVSARTKCMICDTKKKQTYTVGKKPRDGQFGGCFIQKVAAEFPTIYTGRPGSRIWEANIVGQVQATHQFKQLLAIPPLPVVGPSKHPVFQGAPKPQSFSFPVLRPMGSRFLLTWTDKGVFIFDPYIVDVLLWTSDIRGIVDAGSHKGQLYCLQENGRLHRYFLLTVERCVAKLFAQSIWEQCAQLCTRFASGISQLRARRHVPISLIKELNYQLLDETKDLELVSAMEDLTESIQAASPGNCSTTSSRRSSLESCDSVRLESGIYLIRNRHDSEDSYEDLNVQPVDNVMASVELEVPQNLCANQADVSHNTPVGSEDITEMFSGNDTDGNMDLSLIVSNAALERQDVRMHSGSLKPSVVDHGSETLTGSINNDREDVTMHPGSLNPSAEDHGTLSETLADKQDVTKHDGSLHARDRHSSNLSTEAWVTNTANIPQDVEMHDGSSNVGAELLVSAYSNSKNTNDMLTSGENTDSVFIESSTMQTAPHEPLYSTPQNEPNSTPIDLNSSAHSTPIDLNSSAHSTNNDRAAAFEDVSLDNKTTQSGNEFDQNSVEMTVYGTNNESQFVIDHAKLDESTFGTSADSTEAESESIMDDARLGERPFDVPTCNTENDSESVIKGIRLEQRRDQAETELEQSIVDTSTDILTQDSKSVPIQLLHDNIVASCIGPRTTPSPEMSAGDGDVTSEMPPHWDKNVAEFEMAEEQFPVHFLESSIESDTISQDSISLSDISTSSSSQKKESVPFSQSNNVPIPNTSQSSLNANNSPSASLLHDASPTRIAPPLRRTMSVPSAATLAGMDPEAFHRRLSTGSSRRKETKKKKKRTKIVQIGEVPSPIISEQDGTPTKENKITASTTTHTPPPLSPEILPTSKAPPVRSKSSPSSQSLSAAQSSSPKKPDVAPRSPPVQLGADAKEEPLRVRPWETHETMMWQTTSSATNPANQGMFVELPSPQKLNLPSVNESITAMKESLSSTLTNAKSFLLNKMDSKEDLLHHSASAPIFNYFPEEDRTRVDRLQSLIQVGKEQIVHPAARGLIAATSSARSNLEEPSILYSPRESKKILEEWVEHLHGAIQELYTEHPQAHIEETSISDMPGDSKEETDHEAIHEHHAEQYTRVADTSLEEPSETESTDTLKDTEIKDPSPDAITTTRAVHSSPRINTTATSPEQQHTNKISPSSKGRSALGFLERLGSGGHSMAVFDDDKKLKAHKKDISLKETDQIQDDALVMDPVPNLSPKIHDSMVSSETESPPLPSKDLEKKPSRSESDAELAKSCYTSDEVIVKQEYCVTDPFQLPSEVHQEIGELALMCFEMGLYGKLRKCSGSDPAVTDQTESSTKQIFEVGEPNVLASVGELDKSVNANQSGSPFYVANHVLPSYVASDHAESDKQVDDLLTVDMETDVDKVAAVFIKEYFHFLDVAKLRDVLSLREDHRELSFQAIIRCLQEKYKDHGVLKKIEETEVDVGIDHLRNVVQKSPGLDLCFAIRIYHNSHALGIEYMTQIHPRLRPWEALHIITQSGKDKSDCGRDYLSFVSGILDATAADKRDVLLADICKETTIRLQLLQFALSHNAQGKEDLFCSCGTMPRPGAHIKVWTNHDLLVNILKLDASTDTKQEMLQYCQQHGYWPGILMLLQELGIRQKALTLAVQLSDIDILSSKRSRGCGVQPKDLEEWKSVLSNVCQLLPYPIDKDVTELHCLDCNNVIWPRMDPVAKSPNTSSDWPDVMHHQSERPECDWSAEDSIVANSSPDWLTTAISHKSATDEWSDWSPSITWESMATLLVRCLGSQVAVKLLRGVAMPEGALTRQFHQACIVSTILEKAQRTLSHHMLERVDTYLWSKRPTTLAPSLYQLIRNETKMATARRPGEPAKLEEQMALLASFGLPEGEFHFLEEPDCHWGTHIDINSHCCVCGVTLHTSLPMGLQGIRTFSCGHVFHKLCIHEKVCLVCYENKISKPK